MRIEDFNARLKNAILIADGAMGSLLHESVGPQRCFEELNTSQPEAVVRVHRAYIQALEKGIGNPPRDVRTTVLLAAVLAIVGLAIAVNIFTL